MSAKRLALDSMLLALAAAFSFLESLLPLPLGMRLGLSSLVTIYALLMLSSLDAITILLIKAGFAALTRGITAGLLSLCGGMLSCSGMMLLLRFGASLLLSGSLSGLLHNLGQLLAAICLLRTSSIFAYFPVLAAAGMAAGAVTAWIFYLLLPHLPHFTEQSFPKGLNA